MMLVWRNGADYKEFIAMLERARAQNSSHYLVVDENFATNMYSLYDLAMFQVMCACSTLNIVLVNLFITDAPPGSYRQKARMIHLLETLAGMKSITIFNLDMHPRFYPVFLPIIHKTPNLSTLYFKRTLDITPDAARALAVLLQIKGTKYRHVNFASLNCSNRQAHNILCDGIRRARINRIEIHKVQDGFGAACARALTDSQLGYLDLDWLGHLSEDDFRETLPVLIDRLPKMACLTGLRLNFIQDDESLLTRVVDVMRVADQCPLLQDVVIYTDYWSPDLENEVLKLLVNNPNVESLDVCCNPKSPTPCCYSAPLLLSAMAEKVTFDFSFTGTADQTWDPHFMDLVESITLLNRSGRLYMIQDANDLDSGWKVLGCVSDRLNALYYHLRENPKLAYGARRTRTKPT